MFQLIIAVISIALISALAIASIFYGGSAFNDGNLKSQAVALINTSQQIEAANIMWAHKNLGVGTLNINNLVSAGYLSALPATGESTIDTAAWELFGTAPNYRVRIILRPEVYVELCKEINRQASQRDDSPYPTMIYGMGCFSQNGNIYFYNMINL